jgi:hypothetical protein
MKTPGWTLPAFFFVALCVCAGCGRQRLDLTGSMHDVRFVLNGGGAGETRATAVVDETYLSEWCLYIVDENGDVQDAVPASQPYATRNLSEGSYMAYAVINCGLNEDSFDKEEEITAFSRILAAETDVFSMYGRISFRVPEDTICTIPVQRLVSKVEIRKIGVDFSRYPDLDEQPFTLDRMYLINVSAEAVLADSPTFLSGMWYNKRGYVSCEADELIYDAVGIPIAADNPYTTPHYYYCYQNNAVSDSHAPT